MAGGLVLTAIIKLPLYGSLIQEDGWVENGSVVFWVLAALCSACALRRRRGGAKGRSTSALYLLLIAFFIACAGEEVSWGQRILHWQTPSLLYQINVQHETNLHNVWKTSLFENAFFLLTTAFFFYLPRALRTRPLLRRFYEPRRAPVIAPAAAWTYGVAVAAWLIVGVRCGTLGFGPLSLWGYYTQMDDELYEFMAAYAFFTFALLDLYVAAGSSRETWSSYLYVNGEVQATKKC